MGWIEEVTAAATAREIATAAEAQTIRDAVAAGVSQRQIATTLGTQSRDRVARILAAEPDSDPAPPQARAVFVRGAGRPQPVWDRLIDALHRRGLIVIRDRTSAWHLSRGGVEVIMLDMSCSPELADGESVAIRAVVAKYGEGDEPTLKTVAGGIVATPWVDRDTVDTEALARMVIGQCATVRGGRVGR